MMESARRFVPLEPLYIDAARAMYEEGVLTGEMRYRVEQLLHDCDNGKPPMHDRLNDVSLMVDLRMIEISEGISPHRSDVAIVQDHPALWDIMDRSALDTAIRFILIHQE